MHTHFDTIPHYTTAYSFPKEALPKILRIFSFPHPAKCDTFCYLLHEGLAIRAGFISSVVNVVLHIAIVTKHCNHAHLFTTSLSPSSVTLLGPNPFGRLLPSTVSHPSHTIPLVILVSTTPKEQGFAPSPNYSKSEIKKWSAILTSWAPCDEASLQLPETSPGRETTVNIWQSSDKLNAGNWKMIDLFRNCSSSDGSFYSKGRHQLSDKGNSNGEEKHT